MTWLLISPNYRKKIVNLFFEPSTRTQYSFAIAASRLGMCVINFNTAHSSLQKRETLLDTVNCFVDLGTDLIVLRSKQEQYYNQLTEVKTAIINGGDGTGSHPTQVLLDLVTIFEQFHRFHGLKALIVGDIRHSRVAKSHYKTLKRLGVMVDVAGPTEFSEPGLNNISTPMNSWATYDVILLLRYQRERHVDAGDLEMTALNKHWGLTVTRHATLKPQAIVIHPGPVNWGWEITPQLAKSQHLRIRAQVTNGVYTRMALITWLLGCDFPN